MRATLTLLSCALLASLSAYGQGEFGRIAGSVTDPSGAVVRDATIVVTNAQTSLTQKTVSTEQGYEFLQLPPGEYSLTAEATGFKKLERTGIKLEVADRLTVNLSLTLGQTTETISVVSEVPLLRTQDAQEGDVIGQTFIMDLPVLDHNPLELLRLSSDFRGTGVTTDKTNSINGGRPLGLEYYVDGVAVETGLAHQVSDSTPTMEDTQEFKVVTNGVSAEYGRMSGGYVELVTKSGTNEYHGQIYEYLQNRVFNANSWGNNSLGVGKDLFQYNRFGGAVGGPVWIPKLYNGHNKTFFFADYQRLIYNTAGQPEQANFPTQAMRNGDLSGINFNGTSPLLYNQYSPVICSSTGQPYSTATCTGNDSSGNPAAPLRTGLLFQDGQHIPVSALSPTAVAIMKLVPLPNTTPSNPNCNVCNDYTGSSSAKQTADWFSFRLDQMITQNQRFFGRFSYYDNNQLGTPGGAGTAWWGPLNAVGSSYVSFAQSLTMDYTWNISPTMMLEAKGAYYFNPYNSGNALSQSAVSSIPVNSLVKSLIGAGGLPETTVAGWGAGNDFANGGYTNFVHNTTYQGNLAMTQVLSKHTLKYGYEMRRYYDNTQSAGTANYWTTGDPVNQLAQDDSWSNTSQANAFGSFLLGHASGVQASSQTTAATNFNYYAGFIQDDYKVTPKLTLNLGLRWEMETPLTERHNNLYFWNPNAAPVLSLDPAFNWNSYLSAQGINPASIPEPAWAQTGKLPSGAIAVAGTPSWPSRYGPGYHPWNFAPRFGAAYQLTQNTILRGAIGDMYLSTTGNAGAQQGTGVGFSSANSIPQIWRQPTNNALPMLDEATYEQPILSPTDYVPFTKDATQANIQRTGGQNFPVVYSTQTHMPNEWDWNVSLQHQFKWNVLLELQYNGNRGVGLLGPNDISLFPQAQFVPPNASIYGTNIQTPFSNTGNWGPTEQLAFLAMPNPVYGQVRLIGANIGKSLYQAMVIRAEKRLSNGLSFIGSYTLSRLKDDVGGPDFGGDITNSSGTGGREAQSVNNIGVLYGISPLDQTNRGIIAATYELPFGQGRKWANDTSGWGGKLLNGVVGGWQVGGIFTAVSGTPLIINDSSSQINNGYGRLINTWPSYTGAAASSHNIADPNYSGNSSVFQNANTYNFNDISVYRFLASNVQSAQVFTYGTLNPVYPGIRNPAYFDTDLSMMKNFAWSEGKYYLQIRVEGQNFFNQRGWPNYNNSSNANGASLGTPSFGLLLANPTDTSWQHPRVLQFSARIVF